MAQKIVPGFKILDHFGVRTLLDEIRQDIWKEGEVVKYPNRIEDISCEFSYDEGTEYIETSNSDATYELNGNNSKYIRITSDNSRVTFESDTIPWVRIELGYRKGKDLKKTGEKIRGNLFEDCTRRQSK